MYAAPAACPLAGLYGIRAGFVLAADSTQTRRRLGASIPARRGQGWSGGWSGLPPSTPERSPPRARPADGPALFRGALATNGLSDVGAVSMPRQHAQLTPYVAIVEHCYTPPGGGPRNGHEMEQGTWIGEGLLTIVKGQQVSLQDCPRAREGGGEGACMRARTHEQFGARSP